MALATNKHRETGGESKSKKGGSRSGGGGSRDKEEVEEEEAKDFENEELELLNARLAART